MATHLKLLCMSMHFDKGLVNIVLVNVGVAINVLPILMLKKLNK